MSSAEAAPGAGWSLRRRLLIRLLIVVSLLWAANALLVLVSARSTTIEDLDDNLRRAATLLLGFADHEYAESASLKGIAESEGLQRGEFLYQIWSDGGQLLLRSAEAPETLLGDAGPGYSDIDHGGERWRLYDVWNADHTLHLLFAEPQHQRRSILMELTLSLLLPMLLALPALGLLLWGALDRGLQPAREAADSLAQRADDDFDSIPLHRFPDELRALVRAFNALLHRLARALRNERQFAEDVAHELRTPLAAIRLQAQLIERAPDAAAAQHALGRLLSGVDRTTRLVDQLLTLARLDPEREADQDQQTFSLARIVDETVGEFESTLRQRSQQIVLAVSTGPVHSSPHAVYVVLRNLLDNALRHSPAGGIVHLSAQHLDAELSLAVSDQGPGIPATQRGQVLERFVRLDSGGSGSGLGLFIVRRIAEALGGRIDIDEVLPTGARVTVRWPLRPGGD